MRLWQCHTIAIPFPRCAYSTGVLGLYTLHYHTTILVIGIHVTACNLYYTCIFYAVLNIPLGKLSVVAWNNSDSNTHVQKASINGKAIDLVGHPFIDHKDIASGGVLEFWMQLP